MLILQTVRHVYEDENPCYLKSKHEEDSNHWTYFYLGVWETLDTVALPSNVKCEDTGEKNCYGMI